VLNALNAVNEINSIIEISAINVKFDECEKVVKCNKHLKYVYEINA